MHLFAGLVVGMAAMVNAQNGMTLRLNNGIAGDLSMNSPRSWGTGASPLESNNLPQYTRFGSADRTVIGSVTAGQTFDLGSRIELQGTSALVFESSNGQGSSIEFADPNVAGTRPAIAQFGPPLNGNGQVSPSFNWNCNLNWYIGNNMNSIAPRPPCSQDTVQFPSTGSYFMSTYGQRAGADRVEVSGGGSSISSCSNPSVVNQALTLDGRISVQTGPCTTYMRFPSDGSGLSCNVPTGGVSVQCAPQLPPVNPQSGFRPNTNAIVTGDLGPLASRNATYTVVTAGPYAGQVYEYDSATNTLNNRTGSVTITVITAPTANANGIYNIDRTTFNGQTGAVVADTLPPTPPQAANTGDGGGAGGSMLIIIIVVLAIIIVAVVLVVVMKKKGGSQAGDARNTGAVSFENPMYDDATKENPIETQGDGGGLYTEPEYAGDTTGGYMDVPADNAEGGYMDVPASGAEDLYDDGEDEGGVSGYMDVGPDDNDDV